MRFELQVVETKLTGQSRLATMMMMIMMIKMMMMVELKHTTRHLFSAATTAAVVAVNRQLVIDRSQLEPGTLGSLAVD